MTDTKRIIDEIRAALDFGISKEKSDACKVSKASLRALLDHITAQAEEIERLRNALGDPEGVIAHADAITSRAEAAEARVRELEDLIESVRACYFIGRPECGNEFVLSTWDKVKTADDLRAAAPTPPAPAHDLPDGWRCDRPVWRKYPFFITQEDDRQFVITIHHKTAGVHSQFGVASSLVDAFELIGREPLPAYAADPVETDQRIRSALASETEGE
jgi:hypothetical protein